MTASAEQQLEGSHRGTRWLVPPDTPSGLRINLSGLIEAEHLSPEVIALLGKLMAELQRSAQVLAAKGCPKLATCQEYTGDCSALTGCGTYKVKIASP